MALPVSNSDDGRESDPSPAIANCPICDGKMEVVYHRNNQQVCVCTDCHSGLTVPNAAWEIARIKRNANRTPA